MRTRLWVIDPSAVNEFTVMLARGAERLRAARIASADKRRKGYVPISFTAMMPEARSAAST
jgi:hypothetical protein